MAYSKKTYAYGKVVGSEPKPNTTPFTDASFQAVDAWIMKNCKHLSFAGHWSPEKVIAAATKRGVILEEITWQSIDLSGKGRGGVDRKFFVQNGVAQAVQC